MAAKRTSAAATIPVVVLHPSASFQSGLAGALDTGDFSTAEPADLSLWLGGDTSRVAVVADGTGEAILGIAGPATTVVILVPTLDVGEYRRALAAGAHGVAHVDADPATIAYVIRGAVGGEVILPAEIARRLAGRPRPEALQPTPEEVALLQRLSEGATVVDLAEEFYLAERSIRRRLQNVYVKLGVNGRAEAIKRAGQEGIID